MRSPTLMLLVWSMSGMAVVAAVDQESPAATPAVPGSAPDPVNGGDQGVSAGQVQQLLQDYSDKVKTLEGMVDSPNSSQDTLYHNVIEYNAGEMKFTQDAQTATGYARPYGSTIPLGPFGTVTLGGSVTDNDYLGTYPTAPETVHFITGDKNQLASLNNKMQRASHWLNKHTCGGFDWASQFDFMFKAEVLKEYLKNLGEGVIAAAPMALLGAFSPQLAEIVKHLKLIASFDLSAAKMDCQAIQNALTTGINKSMWADNYSNCIANQQSSGIDTAVQQCQQSTSQSVSLPDGTQAAPNNSANANQQSWTQNTVSETQSWLDEINRGSVAGSGAQSASGAGTAGANNSLPAGSNESNALTGVANAASNDPSVLSQIGNDMSGATRELAETLFGSVRFQGTGALELGRKTFDVFDLKLQTHAARLRDQLAVQLEDHYGLINDPSTDQATLSTSYTFMKLWTWQSRGANYGIEPWLNQRILQGHTIPAITADILKERIDDHTMDCCAYLLHLSNVYSNNDAVFHGLQRVFGIEQFVSDLCQLECYLYSYHVLYDEYQQVLTLAQTQPSSQSDTTDLAQKVVDQLKPAMEELRQQVTSKMQAVLTHLKQINAFRPFNAQSTDVVEGVPGALPLPAISFGNKNPGN